MVDFAKDHRDREKCAPEVAVLEASRERFRPIVMTTLAAIMGALPIALGVGASGKDYQSLGLTIAGGLLFSQLVTLFVTPCIYVYVEELRDWTRAKLGRVPEPEAPVKIARTADISGQSG
jgi:hydrophobic/amphiphilic exporter-1 (mainly G- bacteria), HAE1 family